MRNRIGVLVCLALTVWTCVPLPGATAVPCVIQTEVGNIQIEVYPDKAPITANNFLRYVDAKLFDNSTFFRVLVPGNQPNNQYKIEVVQGGDVDEAKCFPPIAHETTVMTGIPHRNGTLSMARFEPGTATSSFSICINDQPELDFGGRRNPDGQGFAAFGQLLSGMEVVKKIQQMEADGQYLKKPVKIICIRRQVMEKEK